MAQRVISLKVLNEFIQGDNIVAGAVGSASSTLFEVDFRGSDAWGGTSRYVSFSDAKGHEVGNQMLSLSMLQPGERDVYLVPLPLDAAKYPGEITMTLAGYEVDGDNVKLRITTEAATFRVMPNDHYAWPSDVIEATVAERMQWDLDMLKDLMFGNWMFLEVGEDGYLYELRIDGFPVEFGLDEGRLEVGFA